MIIELSIRPLSEKEIEFLCEIAYNQIQNFIFAKFAKSKVSILETTIEINNKNENLNVDIEINLRIPSLSVSEENELAREAINEAFKSIENELNKKQYKII